MYQNMLLKIKFTFICLAFFVSVQSQQDVGKMKELAQKWAPKIWLHSGEKFFPYNVNDFLKEMDVNKIENPNPNDYKGPAASFLPQRHPSWPYFLVTRTDKTTLLKDSSSFLYGTDPLKNRVPVYAYLRWCHLSTNTFFVDYWFFFAFNEGKSMGNILGVPVPLLGKVLKKSKKTFGSHIADWEQVIVEFKNEEPVQLHLSVHSVGVDYQYDKASGRFIKPVASKNGMTQISNPGLTVEVVDNHPVLYVAQGSHAIWSLPGEYSYSWITLKEMKDKTGNGIPWDTWNTVEVYTEDTAPSWWWYFGKWGNPKSDCTKDICQFSDGPSGLGGRSPNLQCPPNP